MRWLPHVNDCSDAELLEAAAEADHLGDIAKRIRGPRHAIRDRLRDLGVEFDTPTLRGEA